MAGNTSPIYSKIGNQTVGLTVATANTAKDGTGTVVIVFTADATNGSRVESVVFQPIGTNVASVGRIFINNGSTNTSAANNSYYRDVTLPATTLSEVATMPAVEIFLGPAGGGLVLPAGYRLLITIGTTVAAGYSVIAHGGNY